MDWQAFADVLPPHGAGLTLAHNDHKNLYQSIVEYAKETRLSFVSVDEYERSLNTDEIWELQWYPDTPVGFNKLCASTLPALMAFLLVNGE